jgi:hypothetical protein
MGMGRTPERTSFETTLDDTFIADELLTTAVRSSRRSRRHRWSTRGSGRTR